MDTQHQTELVAQHEADFVAWAKRQVSLIEAQCFDAVDWRNVLEELMAVGAQ